MHPNLLAIETATDVCSVALMHGGRVGVELTLTRPRAHAENLVVLIQDALRYGRLETAAVDAVAVSMGPGSYTGLRIGVSAAKGLAAAVDARLIGVPSLEALAASAAEAAAPGDAICAAFNARRDEVYAAAYRVDQPGTLTPLAETTALKTSEVAGWLLPSKAAQLWLVGDGAPRIASALPQPDAMQIRLLDPSTCRPAAGWVARLAHLRWAGGQFEDVAAFEPFYLKEFVARKSSRTIFERLPF
jgi:tRNA threonylcarbamoyladenosine biosynthesis protein TsaB